MRRVRDDAVGSNTAEDELDVEVAGLDGARVPHHPETRPRRVWRAVAAIGALLAIVFVALNGPVTLASIVSQTWQQVHTRLVTPPRPTPASPVLRASPWSAISLPPGPAFVRDVIFRPAAGSPLAAYVCGLVAPTGDGSAALALYVTRDGAHSWSALKSPVAQAATCQYVVDVSEPQHVLLLTTLPALGLCAAPFVYDSDDWGATWRKLSLPAPLNAACSPSFFLVNGKLYAWSQDGHYAVSGPPGSPLMVSADGGLTWANAFAALPAAALPAVLGAHADGSVLVQVEVQGAFDTGPPVAPALWCRDGTTGQWSLLANTPELSPNVTIATDPAVAGCGWSPIYAFAFLVDPGGGVTSITSLEVLRGSTWESVPTSPVRGASGRQPLGVGSRILGVGPYGTLVIDAPDTSLTGDTFSPPHVIWGWNPQDAHWRRDAQEEPGNARIDGFSWDHSNAAAPTAVLWLFSVNWGVPAFTGVFHSTIIADQAPSAGAG